MLAALNINNEKVIARDANRDGEYFCPVCGESLILKRGEIRTPHFSHKSYSECHFGVGESGNHMAMKEIIRDYVVQSNNVTYEDFEHIIKFPNGKYLIADYFAVIKYKGKLFRVAFEIVEKHDNYDDFEAKNVEYFNNDVYVVWIFNHDHVNPSHRGVGVGRRFRTKEIHRKAHAMGFGKVYSINLNDKRLYCTHFYKRGRNKSERYPESWMLRDLRLTSFRKEYRSQYLPFNVCKANKYIEKWW